MRWRKRVGEKKANAISKQASQRGTSVHTICEKYLDNDPDYLDGVMPNNIQTFQTMKPIMNDMIGTIYAQEMDSTVFYASRSCGKSGLCCRV